jgi:CheY-like chemotaxis protein
MSAKGAVLTALSIVPNRELASQFSLAVEHTRAFQIVAELKQYPSHQTLEMRLRQTKPDVILLDLATDLDAACELIRAVLALNHPTHVVGLHVRNDSDAILRSLRMGATEFLYAPFEAQIQTEAITRLRRLLQPEPAEDAQPGSLIVFSSVKPGSGASTLAAQTAFALRRTTSQRVLLADFDLMGGIIGFYLKLTNTKSLVDALQFADQPSDTPWPALVATSDGVDILPAPETPYTGPIDAGPAARGNGIRPHELRLGRNRSAGGIPASQLDDHFRIRPGLSGHHFRVAQPPPGSQGGGHLLRAAGLSEGAVSDRREPHQPPRRNCGSDMEKLFNCSVNSRFRTTIFRCIARSRWPASGRPLRARKSGRGRWPDAVRLRGRGP